jgi:hypothetical protein
MKHIFIALILLSATRLAAQDIDQIVTPAAVGKVEGVLSADDMRGRAVFTPDIERAADFIESRFRAAGLKTWNGSDSYRQPFSMIRTSLISATATLDGQPLPSGHVAVLSSATDLSINENGGYIKAIIKAGSNIQAERQHYMDEKQNYIVLVDTSFAQVFPRLARSGRQQFKSDRNIIFILTNTDPAHFSVHIQQQVTDSKLANVVGILPGRSNPKEIVIFSAHYDHLGVGRPVNGDSIYNGANDDASGTTAVILLADYFAKKKDNARTLVFAAFTAEEIGEFGSQYFSGQFDPNAVVAMFNLEMIGTESKWGTNSAYITGYERSDMGKILEKNLAGSSFTFYPDPYPSENLFYRSDNASLAKLGVPAHTISTSKMDPEKPEPHYHKPSDEISTLDMNNMAQIIKAIALSSTSIVEGNDTPTRVDISQVH